MEPVFVGALDLGQANDRTAFVILECIDPSRYTADDVVLVKERRERRPAWINEYGRELEPAQYENVSIRKLRLPDGTLTDIPAPGPRQARYVVRHIKRWQLGSLYPKIVPEVARIMHDPRLAGAPLVIDGSGVGRGVVDLFTLLPDRQFTTIPVTITAGGQQTTDEWGYTHVPKRDLVAAVQVPLQQGRLTWPERHPEAPILESELLSFQYKITAAGNDTYNAREGAHDDLVLAVGLALWQHDRAVDITVRWIR